MAGVRPMNSTNINIPKVAKRRVLLKSSTSFAGIWFIILARGAEGEELKVKIEKGKSLAIKDGEKASHDPNGTIYASAGEEKLNG